MHDVFHTLAAFFVLTRLDLGHFNAKCLKLSQFGSSSYIGLAVFHESRNRLDLEVIYTDCLIILRCFRERLHIRYGDTG